MIFGSAKSPQTKSGFSRLPVNPPASAGGYFSSWQASVGIKIPIRSGVKLMSDWPLELIGSGKRAW